MKRNIYLAGGCLIALLVLFFGFDPNRLPSFILILPFLLLFIMIVSFATFLLEKHGLSRGRSLRIAALGAATPILLLVLQSIGQLTLRDILTLGILFILSFFYISKSAPSST